MDRLRLRGYQRKASTTLITDRRVYLLSDMGSGKTAIVLHALATLVPQQGPFLIVAPKLVAATVWESELKKWLPEGVIRMVSLLGPPAKRKAALKSEADCFLINYELTPWLAEQINMATSFKGVIFDEISRLKSANKKRWKCLLPLADSARYVWGLTGTPLSTSLLDLFGQYRMIDRGTALGHYVTHYKQAYFFQADRNGFVWKPRYGAKEAIFERIKPVTTHITQYDQLDIAETFTNEIKLRLPNTLRDIYKELVKEFVIDLPDGAVVTAQTAAVLTGKLTQYTGGGMYAPDGHYQIMQEIKYNALDEVLENLKGQPVLVVYAYRGEAEEILRRHKGGVWLGQVEKDTTRLIRKWSKGELPYMLIHPASAGHGLNLQSGGHHIIWFAGTWSQEMYRQTNARIARSGQKYPVYIHHLLLERTIDVVQYRIMQGRMGLQDDLKTFLKDEDELDNVAKESLRYRQRA